MALSSKMGGMEIVEQHMSISKDNCFNVPNSICLKLVSPSDEHTRDEREIGLGCISN